MDPLHLSLALSPLAVYLLLLGATNLSTRPRVVSGSRDLAALAMGLSGFVVVGPMELFLPSAPARHFGGYIWLLLIALYALTVLLVVLLMRPRLVVYNATESQLRPVLQRAAEALDQTAAWTGDSLMLPQLFVQLHLESSPSVRNVELVSSGPKQNLAGWKRLEHRLSQELQDDSSPGSGRNPYGILLTLLGLLCLGAVTVSVANHHQQIAQSLLEMLRLH